jgi:hypothetical protein
MLSTSLKEYSDVIFLFFEVIAKEVSSNDDRMPIKDRPSFNRTCTSPPTPIPNSEFQT